MPPGLISLVSLLYRASRFLRGKSRRSACDVRLEIQDPVPEGHQPGQPADRPNLRRPRSRRFRRRNVNRRRAPSPSPHCENPVEIACVISFAEVWPRSVSRHRPPRVSGLYTYANSMPPRVNRGETMRRGVGGPFDPP